MRRTWRAALLAALILVGSLIGAAPSSASTSSVVLCKRVDYGCLAGTGYTGQTQWTSWGPGHNCVSYAAYRLARNGSPQPWGPRLGNAISWDEKARAAGYRVDTTPAVGSIMQWDSGTYGHVAYVEEVTATYVRISEDAYLTDTSGYAAARQIGRSTTSFAAAEFIHVRDRPAPPAGSPIGVATLMSGASTGLVQLTGWVVDPDAPTSTARVQVYVDGPAGTGRLLGSFPANVSRPDVESWHPGAGDAHGYSLALGGLSAGRHDVWVYGPNLTGGGSRVLLRAQTVNVPAAVAGSPDGRVDRIEGRVGGAARVVGWTLDPDDLSASTEVRAFVDGPAGSGARMVDLGVADDSRPEVAEAYPGAGDGHGYDGRIRGLSPGRHVIWVYARNAAGGGTDRLLRAAPVTVPGPSPIGRVDHLSGAAPGLVQLTGWALDPDAPTSMSRVQVYVDGPAGTGRLVGTAEAGVTRPDVAARYPGAGSAHGFSLTVPRIEPGPHEVWVYAPNLTGAGSDRLLTTQTVTVPALAAGTPDGRVDSAASPAPGTARVTGWTIDPDDPTVSTQVRVFVDGPAGWALREVDLGTADVPRPDVARAYPAAGEPHGFDATVSELSPGRHVLWIYAVNAVGGGADRLLRAVPVTVS